jgi:ubiquinone/menaquinone biosynthesis C-methylase UbiE
MERLEWLKENSENRILELGCSTGHVSEYVGVHTGIDIDSRRLWKGRIFRRGTRYLKMDARDLRFPDDSFDTVIVSEILEHMHRAASREVVEEAARVGRKVLIIIPKKERFLKNPEHVWIPLEKKI